VFLYLAVRNTNLREVGRAFAAAHFGWLIPSIVANFIGLWIRSVRWGVLLKPVKSVGMRDLFPSTIIGFMANNLFPARVGEFVRALVLGRRTNVRATSAFATIVLERMFDGMTILLYLVAAIGLFDLPFPEWLRKATAATVCGYALGLGVLIALKIRTAAVVRMFEFLFRPLPERIRTRLLHMLRSFADGLQMLRSARSVLWAAVLSVVLWIFPALAIHFAMLAGGIHLPVTAAFFLLIVVVFGVIVPSAPGFVGTIQYMSVLGLSLFGIAKSQALSYSLLYHLSQYIPVTALGLIFFFSTGLSFSKIRGAGAELPEEPPAP